MTALIAVGALLTLAQAIAGVRVYLHVGRFIDQHAARLRVLESQALTFARHSDVVMPSAAHVAELQRIGAALDAHIRGSRHRKPKPEVTP